MGSNVDLPSLGFNGELNLIPSTQGDTCSAGDRNFLGSASRCLEGIESRPNISQG